MKIKEITSRMVFDFEATMECEHCGYIGELKTGYNDFFFHERIIPAMLCSECGKNRDGGTETENPHVGVMTI
jgi:hypothetical protein